MSSVEKQHVHVSVIYHRACGNKGKLSRVWCKNEVKRATTVYSAKVEHPIKWCKLSPSAPVNREVPEASLRACARVHVCGGQEVG
jgi:hypothetical protein